MSKGGLIDNAKELLDVVDENDKVIGQMTKKEIHDGNKIRHREVGILIYDSSGNLLLQQRSRKKQKFASEWTISVTGHVLSGQTPEEAAHTELMEELGFDTKLKYVKKRLFDYDNHSSFGYIYTGVSPKHINMSPDRDELERASFFTREKTLEMIKGGQIGPLSALTIQNYLTGKYD